MRIAVFELPYRSPPLLLRDQFLLQGVALWYIDRPTLLTDITYVQIFIAANFVIKVDAQHSNIPDTCRTAQQNDRHVI